MKTINTSLANAVKNTKNATENINTKLNEISTKNSMNSAVDNMKNFKSKHDYILGSHNTMSYLTPKNWFYKLIAFTARCQSKSIQEQYEKYGVRLFDLRFRFNKKGEISFAHGTVEYKGNKDFILSIFEYLNSVKDTTVIIRYENKEGEFEKEFKEWCKYLEKTYTNIRLTGGINKWKGKHVYKFKNSFPSVEDKYSSCNVNEPGKPVTGTIIDDLCPIMYAKANNRKNRLAGTIKDYLLIDFVEIG